MLLQDVFGDFPRSCVLSLSCFVQVDVSTVLAPPNVFPYVGHAAARPSRVAHCCQVYDSHELVCWSTHCASFSWCACLSFTCVPHSMCWAILTGQCQVPVNLLAISAALLNSIYWQSPRCCYVLILRTVFLQIVPACNLFTSVLDEHRFQENMKNDYHTCHLRNYLDVSKDHFHKTFPFMQV